VHTGATWRIPPNRPCAAAVRPVVKSTLTACCGRPPYVIGQAIIVFALWFLMAALRSRCGHYIFVLFLLSSLWPPYVIEHAIIFVPCGFYLSFFLFLLSFFPRLISAAADWMSTILPHSVSTKKRPPKYNGVEFEILDKHH